MHQGAPQWGRFGFVFIAGMIAGYMLHDIAGPGAASVPVQDPLHCTPKGDALRASKDSQLEPSSVQSHAQGSAAPSPIVRFVPLACTCPSVAACPSAPAAPTCPAAPACPPPSNCPVCEVCGPDPSSSAVSACSRDGKLDCVSFRHGDISSHKKKHGWTLEASTTAVSYLPHVLRPFIFHHEALVSKADKHVIFPDYMLVVPSVEQDPFTARLVHDSNPHEWHVEEAFAHALEGRCDKSKLVLDCGANIGHTVALSASMGCSVVAFELQPRMHKLMRMTAIANDWNVTVRGGVSPGSGHYLGPFRYYPLGTVDGYPDVNNFLSAGGGCDADGSDPYCVPPQALANVLDDFTQDLELVKLDTDSNELDLMFAIIGRMNNSTRRVWNWILEGNNPGDLVGKNTPLFTLCHMGYHTFLLDSPVIGDLPKDKATKFQRLQMKGYIHDALYVPPTRCDLIDPLVTMVQNFFGSNFIGNYWITKRDDLASMLTKS